jgi:hypothetical protein
MSVGRKFLTFGGCCGDNNDFRDSRLGLPSVIHDLLPDPRIGTEVQFDEQLFEWGHRRHCSLLITGFG